MEFKYRIGFLIPKYGEIIGREIVASDDIQYRVKMNYDDPENEATEVFTEEVIDYYIEQYLNKNKNYKLMSAKEMQKFKEDKLKKYVNMIRNKNNIK